MTHIHGSNAYPIKYSNTHKHHTHISNASPETKGKGEIHITSAHGACFAYFELFSIDRLHDAAAVDLHCCAVLHADNVFVDGDVEDVETRCALRRGSVNVVDVFAFGTGRRRGDAVEGDSANTARDGDRRRYVHHAALTSTVTSCVWKSVAQPNRFENKHTVTPALKSALPLNTGSIPLQVALLRPEERSRADEQNDAFFYSVPRFIQYVDENFDRQVKGWYHRHLKTGDVVLDLCSGYDSHLPDNEVKSVTGHGMCAPELAANSELTASFVKDLNADPALMLKDGMYDRVLCCMGLQYLKYPEDVCREVFRILKPGGEFLVSFTSHCFPEKTITGWLERTLDERSDLVRRLLLNAGFVDVRCVSCVATPDCPDVISDSVSDCAIDADVCSSLDFPGNDTIDIGLDDERSAAADPFYGIVGMKSPTGSSPNAARQIVELGPLHLDVLDELDLSGGLKVPYDRYRRALYAYSSLCDWAISLGIPKSAVWLPNECDTIESLKKKRDYMKGMIASFVSSGL